MKNLKIVMGMLLCGCILMFVNVWMLKSEAEVSTLNGWREEQDADGNKAEYWYENGIKQGTEGRGKEIYDPVTDAWYWLDAVQNGAKAVDKDIYQESDGGKWVRYGLDGRMIKGEDCKDGLWYYFEPITGTMTKGPAILPDGRKVFYDTQTGQMVKGKLTVEGEDYVFDDTDGHLLSGKEDQIWITVDEKKYWYEDWQRQGWIPGDKNYRGKEIYDKASGAWYWLDNVQQGAMAVSKDVYQDSLAGEWGEKTGSDGEKYGKWVRYDKDGHMVKGWDTNESGKFYFDKTYGTMAKGEVTIEGQSYQFDAATGIMRIETTEDTNVSEDTSEDKAEGTSEDKAEDTADTKLLVAYFSCTGNTEKIAESIADILAAEKFEIVPETAYTDADLNYGDKSSRTTKEQNDDTARPAIKEELKNIEQYDTIFLGYPIWWGQAPKIMYTFVESYDFTGKTIVPFCTSGSSAIGTSATNLERACKGKATWLAGHRFSGKDTKETVEAWVQSLEFVKDEEKKDEEKKDEEEKENMLKIQVGEVTLEAELADNSSVDALKEKLAEGELTIQMQDYANFEKVGPLGFDLPTNDEQIDTGAGDLILYQGNKFVIYYSTNSWKFTRLGKIKDATTDGLKKVLGDGDVTVTLSLP